MKYNVIDLSIPSIRIKPRIFIIERALIKKPNLGGWIDIRNGIEYRNGDSQTGPAPKRVPVENTCSRKVQTSAVVDRAIQLDCTRATQMGRRDCYIASNLDKYVTPKPYETSEEMQLRMDVDGKARIIQRCYRAFRFLRWMKEAAAIYRKLREDCERLEEEKNRERKLRHEAELQALSDPTTRAGLEALLARTFAATSHCPQRQRALILLSERQRSIRAASTRVPREIRARRTRLRFLAKQCQPRRWQGRKGQVIEMLGLRNQAAIECRDLYRKLAAPVDLKDSCRLEILIKARGSIECHYCKTANVFRTLLDQEIVLLSKRVHQHNFDNLRKRITGAFLNFLRNSHNCTCQTIEDECRTKRCDYEFREPLDKTQILCTSCNKMMSRNDFPITSRKHQFNKCKDCLRLRELADGPTELGPFISLLTQLRNDEPNGLADAMSPEDIRHLVLDIWHGRSALSERTCLSDLRLPRYVINEPWSPWNCLLLAEEEVESHLRVGGAGDHYAIHLRRRIHTAHRAAKIDFRGLLAFERSNDLENADDGQVEGSNKTSTMFETTMTHSIDESCTCDYESEGRMECPCYRSLSFY